MKKRLLITSIVMMLVVAVALSTATYAWFTSNANVTASSISMTAATNNDAALGIGWGVGGSGSAGTEITASISETLAPMAPKALATSATITTTENIQFNYATTKTLGGKLVFNAPIADPAPTPVTFSSGANTTFFVKNLSPANAVSHVYIIPTITADSTVTAVGETEKAAIGYTYYSDAQGATAMDPQPELGAVVGSGKYKKANDGSALVRIAVFKKDATSEKYELVCVFAQTGGANTVKGIIAGSSYVDPTETTASGDIAASPMSYFTSTTAASGFDLGALDATEYHDLAIITWLDGAVFTDAYQNYKAKISFTFQTTAPSVGG